MTEAMKCHKHFIVGLKNTSKNQEPFKEYRWMQLSSMKIIQYTLDTTVAIIVTVNQCSLLCTISNTCGQRWGKDYRNANGFLILISDQPFMYANINCIIIFTPIS